MASESVDFAFGGAVMEHIRDPRAGDSRALAGTSPGWLRLRRLELSVGLSWLSRTTISTLRCTASSRRSGDSRASRPGSRPMPTRAGHCDRCSARISSTSHRSRASTTSCLVSFTVDLRHLLDEMDARIPAVDRFRTAAAVYFFGVKQPNGFETILPEPVIRAHRRRADLQARYPQPLNVAVPDNLMTWARQHGAREEPEIQRYFESVVPFAKDGRAYTARAVRDWPDQLMTRAEEPPAAAQAGRRRALVQLSLCPPCARFVGVARRLRRGHLRWLVAPPLCHAHTGSCGLVSARRACRQRRLGTGNRSAAARPGLRKAQAAGCRLQVAGGKSQAASRKLQVVGELNCFQLEPSSSQLQAGTAGRLQPPFQPGTWLTVRARTGGPEPEPLEP